MTESDDTADVGAEYAEYLKGLSQAQEARKASLEQRGLAVIRAKQEGPWDWHSSRSQPLPCSRC